MKRTTDAGASRRATPAIPVWCLPEERRAIVEAATAAGLSLSSFLRAAGLGTPVKSVIDLEQVESLAKINADQGRLGGLLKLWLSKEGRFVPGYPDRAEITALLDQIRQTQDALQVAARRLVDQF